ncbi:hypothetical protein Csa_019928, partial [Cucumis sativus]
MVKSTIVVLVKQPVIGGLGWKTFGRTIWEYEDGFCRIADLEEEAVSDATHLFGVVGPEGRNNVLDDKGGRLEES